MHGILLLGCISSQVKYSLIFGVDALVLYSVRSDWGVGENPFWLVFSELNIFIFLQIRDTESMRYVLLI